MIDSHCHLLFDSLKKEFPRIIKRANNNNITAILSINTRMEDFQSHYKLIDLSLIKFENYKSYLDNQEIDKAIKEVIELVSEANVYCDAQAPWSLKKGNKINRMNEVLSILIEIIRRTSLMLFPVIPDSIKKIFSTLGIGEDKINFDYFDQIPKLSKKINTAKPVFPRIEN